MTVDPRSDRAIYRQVADILRAQIADGTLAPGAMLPSEKHLADGLAVGRDATRQAIALLRSEGLVRTIKGQGTLVRPVPTRVQIVLNAGDIAVARMPTENERLALSMDEGVPVVVITTPSGSQIYAADHAELVGPS